MTLGTLVIRGAPVTKKTKPRIGRNKKTGKPFVLPSKSYERWLHGAKMQARVQWLGKGLVQVKHEVMVRAVFYRSWRAGDVDNFTGALLDMLQAAGILANDRLVTRTDARIDLDRNNPRIECELFDGDDT
jgi:Holliday junction resolvase RusA-like endonuclease